MSCVCVFACVLVFLRACLLVLRENTLHFSLRALSIHPQYIYVYT